jgi:Phosphoribosyl transferase/TRSP domain C terminus to PRTase_2
MAETAICLGHGVYDQYLALTGRQDVVFSHSTRYRLDRPIALEFLEEHSHAADHIMYLPENEHDRQLYLNARSLVLVDDEASTGNTFVNLANAFHARIPSLQSVVTAVITDWRGEHRTADTLSAMPVPSSTIAILSGEYNFTPAPNLVAVVMPNVVGDNRAKDALIPRNFGRLGLRGNLRPEKVLVHSTSGCADASSNALMRGTGEFVCTRAPSSVLVLGTGEFAYPPFLLAEELEKRGVNVYFQTTTRSPIMVGNAIGAAISFLDNYGDGIPNFVYNVSPGQYDRVVIVHETPAGSIDSDLVARLDAETLEL